MRRLYRLAIASFIVALVALSFASKSSAQQSDEIQKYINEWRLVYEPIIADGQVQYFKDTGHFWQGLATHSEQSKPRYQEADKTQPIEDQKAFTADCLDCKPTDQLDQPAWSELFPDIVDKLPASLTIHVYDGPSGSGFVMVYDYCVDATCYRLEANVGPEAWRSVDWLTVNTNESVIK